MNSINIFTKHSSQLSSEEKENIFFFLRSIYGVDFSKHDFYNALGGLHLLLMHNKQIIGHVAIVQRQISIDGNATKVGYVESMAISSSRQRQGLGVLLMYEVNKLIDTTYEYGFLSQSEEGEGLYLKSGWKKMNPPFYEFFPKGIKESVEFDVMCYSSKNNINPKSKLIADYRIGDIW